jgi:hypothetical protein
MNRRHLLVGFLLVAWSLAFVSTTTALFSRPADLQTDYAVYLPLIVKPEPAPTILYFQADVEIADPGDTIHLEWESSGAVLGVLTRMSAGGPIAEFWNVEPSGTFTFAISPDFRNFISFMLYVENAAGAGVCQGLTLPLTCPDTWFFEPSPEGCPGMPPLYSDGAEQPFETGIMVWVEAQALIYVLFDDDTSPHWAIYPDTWEEGEPLCDAGDVPPGSYQPQRGFGKVWCDEPGVRDRLGWATETETAYETAVQRDSAPKYTTLYLRAADDNVWKLWPYQSGWEKIIIP